MDKISYEKDKIYRTSNHFYSKATRNRDESSRHLSETWYQHATFFNWKGKYSGMDASQLKRLKFRKNPDPLPAPECWPSVYLRTASEENRLTAFPNKKCPQTISLQASFAPEAFRRNSFYLVQTPPGSLTGLQHQTIPAAFNASRSAWFSSNACMPIASSESP